MANVTRVRRQVQAPVYKTQYTLELSEEEVDVLASIFHRIGGDPRGPRGLVDRIAKAIEEAGGPGVYADPLVDDYAAIVSGDIRIDKAA